MPQLACVFLVVPLHEYRADGGDYDQHAEQQRKPCALADPSDADLRAGAGERDQRTGSEYAKSFAEFFSVCMQSFRLDCHRNADQQQNLRNDFQTHHRAVPACEGEEQEGQKMSRAQDQRTADLPQSAALLHRRVVAAVFRFQHTACRLPCTAQRAAVFAEVHAFWPGALRHSLPTAVSAFLQRRVAKNPMIHAADKRLFEIVRIFERIDAQLMILFLYAQIPLLRHINHHRAEIAAIDIAVVKISDLRGRHALRRIELDRLDQLRVTPLAQPVEYDQNRHRKHRHQTRGTRPIVVELSDPVAFL